MWLFCFAGFKVYCSGMHQPHQKIPFLLFIAVGIILMGQYACRQPVKYQTKISPQKQPAFKVFPLDSGSKSPVADKMQNPVVIHNCPVYVLPDTSSQQIASLDILTPLNLKGRVERYYQDTAKTEGRSAYLTNGSRIWYQVEVGKKQGYVAEKYVAKSTFTDTAHHTTYLFGVSVPADTGGFVRSILKYDTQHLQLLSQVNAPANNTGNFKVVEMGKTVLKDVSHLFRIDEDMEYNGGSQATVLIADGDTGLVAFPQTNIGFDDGEGLRQNVLYAPAKGDDGVLKFYIDGDIHNHLQWGAFAVPAWSVYGIPASEILMYSIWRGQRDLNKNNEPIVEKGGKQKFRVLLKRSVFYRWDGKGIKVVGMENW